MSSQVSPLFSVPKDEYTASQIAAINVQKRQHQKEQMDYWNSTVSVTGTGRPVDAVIAPFAPFAAGRPDMYVAHSHKTQYANSHSRTEFGTGENKAKRVMPAMSVWVNLLDYTAATMPVTLVDKDIDVKDVDYVPKNGQDEKVYQACMLWLRV